jgi:tRNA G10  N-methylase Trm11
VSSHREVGGAMSEYYANVKPKMSDFDVQVRVDVVSTKVIVGTQINVDDLSKERHFLRFRNAVTIKTNLAYAMIRCANIKIGDLVVDVSVAHMSCRVVPPPPPLPVFVIRF